MDSAAADPSSLARTRSHRQEPMTVSSGMKLGAESGGDLTPERVLASADLLGQPDENALRASDVTEPIHVFVLNHFVDELRAMSAEPSERVVDVVHGEHDAQVAESVQRRVPVIGDHRRREKSR